MPAHAQRPVCPKLINEIGLDQVIHHQLIAIPISMRGLVREKRSR